MTPSDRPTFRRLVTERGGTTRSAAHGRLVDVTEVELELPRSTWSAVAAR